MQKILAVLAAAMAFVIGRKNHDDALQKQITDRDAIIDNLKTELEREGADDASRQAALEQAISERDDLAAQLESLNGQIGEAQNKAQALADSINDDPAIPLAISPDGTVTNNGAEAPPATAPEAKAPLGSE